MMDSTINNFAFLGIFDVCISVLEKHDEHFDTHGSIFIVFQLLEI